MFAIKFAGFSLDSDITCNRFVYSVNLATVGDGRMQTNLDRRKDQSSARNLGEGFRVLCGMSALQAYC